MADTTITKVDGNHSPKGADGQKYLASGKTVSMRLWEKEAPTEGKGAVRRDYETVGFVIAGRAELTIEGQTIVLEPMNTGSCPRAPSTATASWRSSPPWRPPRRPPRSTGATRADATMAPRPADLPAVEPVGALEAVAHFHDAMPTGVTVSQRGRIFVNYPKWGDDVRFTVAELRDGEAAAYPDEETNRTREDDHAAALVSVQSVVVDPADRLWILDTGSPMFQPTKHGGPKLVRVDLVHGRGGRRRSSSRPTWPCPPPT